MQILKKLNTGLIFFFMVAIGCVTKPASMSSVDYDEDLSVHRPKYVDSLKLKAENSSSNSETETPTYTTPNLKPSHDITASINTFLDSVSQKTFSMNIIQVTPSKYIQVLRVRQPER